MTVVAAFDLDGTLTDRDCVVPFLRRVAGERRLMLATAVGIVRSPMGARSRDRLKAIAARSLAGTHLDAARSIASDFADEVVRERMRPDTLQRLEQHRHDGHHIVIVSASFALYAGPIGERLGVDSVLATELADDGAVLTGDLAGRNCRGAAKVERLTGWFETVGLRRSAVRLYAYGDSRGDRDLLAFADVPTVVTPARRSRRSSPA